MKDGEKFCSCCEQLKPKSKFFPSLTDHTKSLPYCKECIQKKYKSAFFNTKSDDIALWAVCMELNIPLFQKHYDNIHEDEDVFENASKESNVFELYYTSLKNDKELYFKGNYDSDMELGYFKEMPAVERDEWIKNWGDNYTEAQYRKLDEYFNNYTSDIIDDMSVGMILRYRDLCKLELKKFEGNEKGVTDEILKLMKLLKIDNFQETLKSNSQIAYEKAIAMIEYTKPAEYEDLRKYADLCQYEKDRDEMMRCLQNAIAGTRDYPDVPRDERG